MKGDAESEANRVLAKQHFKKADLEQRETAVKHILGTDEGSSELIAKIAKVVADKHESYHEVCVSPVSFGRFDSCLCFWCLDHITSGQDGVGTSA